MQATHANRQFYIQTVIYLYSYMHTFYNVITNLIGKNTIYFMCNENVYFFKSIKTNPKI